MNKTTVLILFGGMSNEHEVSLRSATSVIENIDRERFEPVLMGITKNGEWKLFEGEVKHLVAGDWEKFSVPAILSPDRTAHGIIIFRNDAQETKRIDVAYPAVHGQNCEDGVLQGLLELSGIPYVGCGVASSAVTFDKGYTHIICEQAGIPMAKWQLVTDDEAFDDICERIESTLGFPCFVKPANSGSSVGCSPAKDRESLKTALDIAFAEDSRVIVEELVTAHEVECAVMGNRELFAPTTGEIVTTDGFYDYESKYVNDSAKLMMPATVSDKSNEEVKELAKKVYKVLGCKGLSRVDFFVEDGGRVLFNEINTLPGFTSISMYPKMMMYSGMSYAEIITRLIQLALEK